MEDLNNAQRQDCISEDNRVEKKAWKQPVLIHHDVNQQTNNGVIAGGDGTNFS